MKAVHRLLLVAVAWWLRQGSVPTAAGDCPDTCGGVSVPYPFGLEDGCPSSPEFLLHCNTTKGKGEQLQLGNFTVRKISPGDSTMLVSLPVVYECYNENGSLSKYGADLDIDLSTWPQYTLSDTRNSLIVLGCDTYALMSFNDRMLRSGCISYCNSSDEFAKDTTCSGLGCCQASIPKGLKKLHMRVSSFDWHMSVEPFSPCGLAFVGVKWSFNMSNWTLPDTQDFGKVDAVLDWMVLMSHREPAQSSNRSSYARGPNTNCSNNEDGSGYRCVCKDGYGGNPYRDEGCQDIENPHICDGKCHNQPGDHTCEDGCHRDDFLKILAGTLGSASAIGAASGSYMWKWRIRRINFRRHGGEHLKSAGVRIFKEAELAKATGNYDESNKLGEGSFGSVYRGKIKGPPADVVVKKPKNVVKHLVKKDVKHELKTVIQVSHKHVVKLKGICLETRVPLLVYEYIPNGTTLFEHIHPNVSIILGAWKNRLKIATQAAFALKHIHSCAIIHGNIKSANILLDQNCSVKVSDFGTSVLISQEHSHITATGIEGTLGYIDPEYLTTGKLTMKSDVYSFGAVLVELLTGKKPTSYVTTSGESISSITKSGELISSVTESGQPMSPITESGEPISSITESGEPVGPVNKSEEEINIISYFVSSEKDKTLNNILPGVIDFKASSDDEMNEVKKVAAIAVKCLHQSSRKRPAMEKVAQDLAAINPSLTDKEKNEGITHEVHATIKISGAFEEASSCLSSLGRSLACPCV